jgi:hypothetical protein
VGIRTTELGSRPLGEVHEDLSGSGEMQRLLGVVSTKCDRDEIDVVGELVDKEPVGINRNDLNPWFVFVNDDA